MVLRLGCWLMVSWAAFAIADDAPATWSFGDSKLGELPGGWSSAKTGDGLGSVWQIVNAERDGKRNLALAQISSEGPRPLFNLCVVKDSKHADVDLAVEVKAVKGEIDQGGGVVWRYRDANNYYITRWNPLGNQFSRLSRGRRQANAARQCRHHARRRPVAHRPGGARGKHIQCYLDGQLLLDVRDDTIRDAGAIGLWSKADAVTWFDNLTLKLPAKE